MIALETIREINREWPQCGWTNHHHKHSEKRGCQNPEAFGSVTRQAIDVFNNPHFVALVGDSFGIEKLSADPSLFGGGLHESFAGGFLDVHADFNIHPDNGLIRRLNLLTFLNEDWREEWGGALELWDKDGCQVRIPPHAGHAVIFSTSDES